MTDKSYVTLEQRKCLVCGKTYDTGDLLLDRRLRNVFDMHTITGNGLCPEDEKKYKDGFIALVECDESKGTKDDPWRTGTIAHIKKTLARELFKDIPEKNYDKPMWYTDAEVVAMLKRMEDQRKEQTESCAANDADGSTTPPTAA